ncbi:MAG: hypothetical protein AAF215_08320 [Cyanobacteria bacterium P01_A01_bin.123]
MPSDDPISLAVVRTKPIALWQIPVAASGVDLGGICTSDRPIR